VRLWKVPVFFIAPAGRIHFEVKVLYEPDRGNCLAVATKLGVEEIGLPISSDPIESLFGLAKHHGVGEIKDADRIAIRLPALCGVPTRSEAEQLLGVSVADQNQITSV
jgi:hypothetical protein